MEICKEVWTECQPTCADQILSLLGWHLLSWVVSSLSWPSAWLDRTVLTDHLGNWVYFHYGAEYSVLSWGWNLQPCSKLYLPHFSCECVFDDFQPPLLASLHPKFPTYKYTVSWPVLSQLLKNCLTCSLFIKYFLYIKDSSMKILPNTLSVWGV